MRKLIENESCTLYVISTTTEELANLGIKVPASLNPDLKTDNLTFKGYHPRRVRLGPRPFGSSVRQRPHHDGIGFDKIFRLIGRIAHEYGIKPQGGDSVLVLVGSRN